MAASIPTPKAVLLQCERCSTPFTKRRGKNRFCKVCAPIREAENFKARREAKGISVFGSTIKCRTCGIEIQRIGRTQKYCKSCSEKSSKARYQRYRDQSPEKALNRYKVHNRKRNQTQKYKDYVRQKITPAITRKRRENPKLNLNHRMSQLIRSGLKNGKGGVTWKSMVDYSIEELMRHLERQFLKGMSWKNMGQWHIDHIIPRSSFSFMTSDDPEFKACWALTNLRPLWAPDNLSKHSRVTLLL